MIGDINYPGFRGWHRLHRASGIDDTEKAFDRNLNGGVALAMFANMSCLAKVVSAKFVMVGLKLFRKVSATILFIRA